VALRDSLRGKMRPCPLPLTFFIRRFAVTDRAQPVIDVAFGDARGLPVSIGVPFPKGQVREGTPIAVQTPGSQHRAAGVRPLVRWPDGSARWALLSFGATEPGPHRVEVGITATPPATPVRLTQSNDRYTLDNGMIRVTLAADGAGPIASLEAHGRKMLANAGDFRLRVDGSYDSAHEPRRTLRVLEMNDHRARVRIEGAHYNSAGERKLSYRLDVELWANWPTLRLDYQFFNLEPGADFLDVESIGMDVNLALGDKTHRHFLQQNHGHFYVRREVRNPDRVAIVADNQRGSAHVEDAAMLLDDVDYPFYLHAPLVATPSWLGVGDATSSVYMHMQDFAAMRPKRIESIGNRLSFDAWPETAGTLELQQGRSRRQVVTLAFAQGEVDSGWIAAHIDAPLTDGRACINNAWVARCGEFDQDRVLPAGEHIRFEKMFNGVMHLGFPQTMFEWGDTADSGYSRTYIPNAVVRPKAGAPAMDPVFVSGPDRKQLDMNLFFEPVWTNNEYDAIWAFVCEVMRTGKHDLWMTAQRLVRHNIEVDFLHYSDHKWIHRATPAHSTRHTTTGAYPSHFWTQGLLQYYCLTGDIDALEVAVALGDKTIENFSDAELRKVQFGFNREIGWAVLALTHLSDITGEARFRTQLEELVNYLMAYDRVNFSGAVNLSNGNARQSLVRQMVGNFFGYASMIEGVDHYARTSGRADVSAWLDQILREILDALTAAHRDGDASPSMIAQAMAIGYERTGDERFLHAAMISADEQFAFSSNHGTGEVKPTATFYRGWVRFFRYTQALRMLDRYEYPAALAARPAEGERGPAHARDRAAPVG